MITAEGTAASESTSVTQSLHPAGCHEDIGEPFGKFTPPRELTGLLQSLEIKLARKGDVDQVLFFLFTPAGVVFCPLQLASRPSGRYK